jgi:hypothetical protein
MVQAPPRGAHAQPLWGIYKVSPVGAVAQLGERLICTQEVAGSIPVSSTIPVEFSKLRGATLAAAKWLTLAMAGETGLGL